MTTAPEAIGTAGAGVPYIDYLPDNADQVISEYPAMAKPCIACPYTAGTEASRNPLTSRLARESTEARSAFWCHLTRQGVVCTHLCAGWIDSLDPAQAEDAR